MDAVAITGVALVFVAIKGLALLAIAYLGARLALRHERRNSN
jgi:hypothetical protein